MDLQLITGEENQYRPECGKDQTSKMIAFVSWTRKHVGYRSSNDRSDNAKHNRPEDCDVFVHHRFRDYARVTRTRQDTAIVNASIVGLNALRPAALNAISRSNVSKIPQGLGRVRHEKIEYLSRHFVFMASELASSNEKLVHRPPLVL
jgi:hypothetical protein